jgi:hypothetical protein
VYSFVRSLANLPFLFDFDRIIKEQATVGYQYLINNQYVRGRFKLIDFYVSHFFPLCLEMSSSMGKCGRSIPVT